MSIHSWSMAGYSYANNASITNSLSAHAVTADTTNSPESFRFPARGNIQSVEVFFTGLSSAGLTCSLFLARDSDGDVGVTPGSTTGSSPVIQQGVSGGATVGFCVFEVNTDFHLDSGVANSADGTIYACLRLSSGTGTADIRVNWRA